MRSRVAVLGLGYVGAVTSACLARGGHHVVGVDSDERKVALVSAGRSPILEPGLDALLREGRASGCLRATTDLVDALDSADVTIVCVGTPSTGNGGIDLTFVRRVSEQIGAWMRSRQPEFHAVLFRSTLLPGTIEDELIPMLERASGRKVDVDFGVGACPEFLRESSAVADFFEPPYTLLGTRESRSARAFRDLFAFLDRPAHEVTIATAETVKYAANAFHAAKITFANEVGRWAALSGVDGRAVMDLVCEDTRLNTSAAYLRPGFTFGGSCLPKDLRALLQRARSVDLDLPMLASLHESNDQLARTAVRKVLDTGARCVAVLGLSFKQGTDDLRESPYVEMAETLLGKGIELRIYDAAVRADSVFGANRAYMDERLPHLRHMLFADAAEALVGAGCAVVSAADGAVVEALLATPPQAIIDLSGRLPIAVETMRGYTGIAW